MSAYRNLHRELILDDESPVWQVQALSIGKIGKSADEWTIVTASADGIVRVFRAREKEASDELDASALSITCTHALLGINQIFPPPDQTLVGCSRCQITRNYVGDDDSAGDIVITALDLTARLRVWIMSDEELSGDIDDDDDDDDAPTCKQIRSCQETLVENATGTLMAACPPNVFGQGDLVAAVACLDGSIALVALGIATPKAKKDPMPAGTIIDHLGSGAVALSLCWHPTRSTLAIGRKDGLVEIMPSSKKGHHRLTLHSQAVRALSFSPDGQVLVTGSDDGFLAVWDINRSVPTLVHHVVNSHASWVLTVTALADSRRFVTSGADGKVHVWQFDQMHAPTHTFHCDQNMWTICTTLQRDLQRLTGGSDRGLLQIFSLEG